MHSSRITLGVALLLVVLATTALRAHALGSRVLFQVDPAVSPSVAEHVGQVLSSVGDVVPADSPAQQGDIAVAIEVATQSKRRPRLRLTYYDAVTAVVLFSDDLPLRDGALRAAADAAIVDKARSALAMVAPNDALPAAQAGADAPGSPGSSPALDPPSDEPAVQSADAEAAVTALLAAGAGIGMYSSSRPLAVGSLDVPASVFPAFDVALAIDGVADGSVTPGLHASYASSIGYELSQVAPGGITSGSASRIHQLRIEAALNVNFGHSRRDVALPIALGYAWTNLRTDVELTQVYRYTLSGPYLAVALRLPLADERVVFRFGPDFGLLLQVSDRIQRAGLASSGLQFGGELTALVRISQRFSLRALLRESHAVVSSDRYSGSFSEALRFFSVGVAAVY